MADYEAWDADRAARIIAERTHLEGAALPILHALQDTFGFIHADVTELLAQALNLSRAEVHGTITFYHDFRPHLPGRHVVKLCRAEACQSVGADALHERIRQILGVEWHGTTGDGAVTVLPVFCLGLCACGPAALVDERPLARLTEQRLQGALAEATA
ncbi:formate dehydrogenase subunit gamma [Marinivivus vitaminiproducens]|uniref:formate dehydrogenase subunit gamma n=1 Tax=Marinivivus vitaminiproducens TaxID=3035935 RepID=UPI0027A878A8|nr:formate dehydrogenase subunit gamma [Geminicoccaceae bacterium SCSIO 64248]